MAHIKVVRRSMRPEEWTDLRFGWLKRHIYSSKWEITNLMIKDARQVSEMEFEYYSDDYRPLQKGDMYFTPDGTAFIKADVDIPKELQGKELWFSLKTAAEICVKVNGKYVGGVDPNRERMLLSPYVDDTKTLHFDMMGYNRSKPDDERNPESLSVRGCRQIFEGAYICTVNHEVQDLVWDFELLLDIAKSDLFNEDYRDFLNRELNNAMNFIDFDSDELTGVAEAKKYVDEVIYANDTYKGTGDVALIAHSHLDIAYYWRRIHAVQKNLRTVLIQLRLMDKYPDFKYTHTQPYVYETLEKYYPDVFKELQQKVKNGQFEPVGAMYVEPDCNIPCAESLIRQCLYGQKTYKRMFGKYVNNAWLPDVFGNSWIMPQILKKSGVDYFVSNKMSTWNDTNRFPHNNFIWKGIDGSSVYACVPPTHFITWNAPSQIQENWEAYIDKDQGGQTMNIFGYGDGGSGCTEEMIELMHRFDKLSVMPKCEHMGGAEFLEKNLKDNKNLEVWDGELYLEMHRGTFTTKSNLKQKNRQLEFKFRTAEMLSVLRGDDNRDTLTALYKKFLVNQFHDILPGSHIHPVYEDAMADYAEIETALDEIIGTGSKYFNTLNFERNALAFVPNKTGSATRHGAKGNWLVPSIPALSSKTLRATKHKNDWFTYKNGTIITPFYTASLNSDGSFSSLYDNELCREWTDGDFNKLKIYTDNPGNYDAWDILPNYKDKQIEIEVTEPLAITEQDGECVTFKTVLSTEKSSWTMLVRFFRQSRGIEVENQVSWNEKHRLAKVEFASNILTRKALCDTSAGFIERETNKNTTWQQARFEVCHHKWCDMSETGGGISLINEGKYGVGFDENKMSLSLLRATIRPDVTSDMGEHDFCYMIMPHSGDAVSADINKIALQYNAPLVKADVKWLLPTFEPLYLQAVKKAEDREMTVVRLSEQNGSRGEIKLDRTVKLLNMLEEEIGETDTIRYSPFEIITLGV
ncbi:glycoside hydrolase family 38 C-terminal domain-containing protein [Eubacterium coprostanoligenes]|uniref:alpha-mannosidase n=1 Tax=Eubacterium coprostanoligenes TaxID=290054 RepID=UPI002A8251F9|nr:glycoside hydrolase family 38 C-terminal domain-containing protein [Eubacterium coprostanoligenes]MDY4698367.1 glycoside hydrolase family 38 C-terminal domain-containing protein [Eubacterium coprostanoligenes]